MSSLLVVVGVVVVVDSVVVGVVVVGVVVVLVLCVVVVVVYSLQIPLRVRSIELTSYCGRLATNPPC